MLFEFLIFNCVILPLKNFVDMILLHRSAKLQAVEQFGLISLSIEGNFHVLSLVLLSRLLSLTKLPLFVVAKLVFQYL